MKKRLMIAVGALAAAVAGLALWALFGADAQTITLPQKASPVTGRTMHAALTLDAGTRTLRGTQSFTAVNETGENLDGLTLRLYMNGENESAVRISGAQAGGQSAAVTCDEDDPTVAHIAFDWEAGARAELTWTVMLTYEKTAGAAVVSLPMPAVYEDGAWRTDSYDELAEPSYAEALAWSIELETDADTEVVFGGALTGETKLSGGRVRRTAASGVARDMCFAVMGAGAIRQRMVDGVLVTAMTDGALKSRAWLDDAQTALESLEAIGLCYPFDALTLALGETGREDGAAYSGLIVLDDEADGERRVQRITRLIARQIFGVWVENDPWNDPWLSMTLASTAELLAYRQRKGAAAYEARYWDEVEVATRLTRPYGVRVGASTAHFGGDAELTQVLRDQGAAMMLGIAQMAGEDALCRALALYADACAGGMGSLEALLDALQEATDSSWEGYLLDGLAA